MNGRRARELRRRAADLRSPTLADEREMLAALQECLPNLSEEASVPAQQMWEEAPVSWREQHAAAVRATRVTFLDRALMLDATDEYVGPAPLEAKVMIVAAVLRCVARHKCAHVVRGDRPLTALPAARVICCDRCASRFRPHVAAHDVRAAMDSDRTCDLCLEEQPPRALFKPFAIAWGLCVVRGDACDACFELATSEMVSWSLKESA